MPFIETITTVKLSEQKKNDIRIEMGKIISVLNKSEKYLMIGFQDAYDLWLGGVKLEKGAYVSVSLFGNAPKEAYNTFTARICNLLERALGIPGHAVYVTFHPVSDWGWNGRNF